MTKADLSANKVICDALSEAFPEIPITSEENKKVDWSVRKEYTYSWCVDPLDGTKEFLKRNGQFATLIALLKGSEAVLGLVQVPVTGQTYSLSSHACARACVLFARGLREGRAGQGDPAALQGV